MTWPISRRTFLAGVGAAAMARAKGLPIQYGYAAITWGTDARKAIDDIASAGYAGIQLRADSIGQFKPEELRGVLAGHKLTFTALSSGDVDIDPAAHDENIAKHTANAKFVRDAGGLYLQVLDQLKPYPRKVTPDECRQLGKLLTELGKRVSEIGIPMAYHNHMNTISEHPQNLDLVMESSDPKYVKLLLDTAHSVAGGGDPAAQIRKYHEHILFLHLKDVVDIPPNTPGARYPFKFVELGKGRVNFPAVLAALEEVKFHGWAVVELDRVPDPGKTPKECAMISRHYLEEKWGAKFR